MGNEIDNASDAFSNVASSVSSKCKCKIPGIALETMSNFRP